MLLSSSELSCAEFSLERLSTSLLPQRLISFHRARKTSQGAWLLSVQQDVSSLAHWHEDIKNLHFGAVGRYMWVNALSMRGEFGIRGNILHAHIAQPTYVPGFQGGTWHTMAWYV